MSHIFITGANRGIGLELTQQFLTQGDQVLATCRRPAQAEALQKLAGSHPEQLFIVPLDVTDPASIREAYDIVSRHTSHLDLLINNAGILNDQETLATFDPAVMQQTFTTNVIGPMQVTTTMLDLVRQGTNPRIINVSSQLGSLQKMRQNWGRYSYNSSKAALNMVSRMLAFDLKAKGITVITLHPGWVQTDMGGQAADLTIPDSARGILKVANSLTLADTGKFFTYAGEEHPW